MTMKKKPNTNIRLKGKDGEEIGVHIDDQDKPRGAYKDAVERGVLAQRDEIVAEAWLNRSVHVIDPNDPHGEGTLIKREGKVTHEEVAAMRAAFAGVWTRIGDDLILPPHPDGLLFGKRANADLITNQMRTEMLNVAAKTLDEMPPEDSAPLLAWINDSRIENFREWLLSKGGWDKAIAERRPLQDELGRCFAGMPAVAVPNNKEAVIEGDELKAWQMQFFSLQLAGSRSAQVETEQRYSKDVDRPDDPRASRSLIEGEPLKYLKALREIFDRELWPVLLKTADKDENGKDLDDPFAWLRIMVRPYVEEQAAHIVQTRRSSISIMVRARAKTEAGEYSAFPRALGESMPMIGGIFGVTYNGEDYANEPTLAERAIHGTLRTLRQKESIQVIPTKWIDEQPKPYTLSLNLDIAKPYLRDKKGKPLQLADGPLEAVMKTATAAKLPALTIKAIPYMIAACGLSDRLVTSPLSKVANDLYPDYATGKGGQIKPWATRQQVDKDLHNIVQAITIAGRGIQMRVPEGKENWADLDLFAVKTPGVVRLDAPIGWAIGTWLLDSMLGGTAGGHFLLNMSRWLPIGLHDPGLFSVILGLARHLDAHRIHGIYQPARQRPIAWYEFADECNVLPITIKDGRSEESQKRSMRESRDKLEARLDVAVELGHLGDWRKTQRKIPGGKGFEFSVVAPADYVEACKMAVKAWKGQSRRMHGKPKGKADKG